MRVQTTFEKIAQGTSQKLFAACFVALRIFAGLAFIYFAMHLLQSGVVSTADPGSASYAMQVADHRAWQTMLCPTLIVLGGLFIVGLLIRPLSVLAAFFVLLNAATSGSINPEGVWLAHGLIALGFCLFAAGGSSHALGLDGIISRNIRRPNAFTKFLFG